MLESFDHNSCFLSIGSYSRECFSVLGFTTCQLALNNHYKVTVMFRLNRVVLLETCVNKTATLSWPQQFLQGIVTYADSGQIIIESPLYNLNQTKHSRVYADKNFPELIQAILSRYGWKVKQEFDFLLKAQYPLSKYIAQYHETDVEFIKRQCSRWGINFCFIHQQTHPVLIFFDESDLIVEKFPETELNWAELSEYQLHRKVLPSSVKINDYNPETPDVDLSMEIKSKEVGSQTDHRPYEFYQTREQGKLILQRRLEYYDCQREFVVIQTDDLNLQLGQKILLHDNSFYIAELNFKIDILSDLHHVDVKLIKTSANYRPGLPALFHMPDITAHVISEHVDEEGRYYISPDYDEDHTLNTYQVRQAQPCTGNQIGFHFPLVKHTKVFITHINGDPDRPVIMGVMPSQIKPHPVTDANRSQHVLRTPHGNQWLMEDNEYNSGMQFSTKDNQAELNILADEIRFDAVRHVVFEAQEVFQKVQENYSQSIKGNYEMRVGNNYKIITEKGDAVVSSGKGAKLSANHIQCHSNANLYGQSKTIQWDSNNIVFQASTLTLLAQKRFIQKANQLTLKSSGKVIITVGSSSMIISSAGIVLTAASVNFNTAGFSSPPPQLGASGGQSAHAQFKSSLFNLHYKNLEERFSSYILKSNQSLVWAGSIREKNTFKNIDLAQPLEVHHCELPVIGVDEKPQRPSDRFRFQPQQNKTHDITLLSQPKYKTISQVKGHFECELLSQDEINYFKNNHNKVTVFIHGYNVPAGHFGKFSFIRTPEEGFADDHINGSGAPNWLLHMEYNLNCATHDCYLEFPWEEKALEYKRILGIHWPGYKKIYDIPSSSGLNFAGMEFNALASGYALLPLMKQLTSAGLEITVIAHSLGCLVAIQLMDLWGREHQIPIEHLFLWEAAVAKTALLPTVIDSLEQKQKALKQSAEGSVMAVGMPPLILYEYYGDFLRQKAARFKDIPPWDLYEKDPFAYFPYAHYAAKKIHVLFSEHDEVLKWAYRANAIFANLPHYNFIFNPLGLYGPDEDTLKLLKPKLQCIDQTDCLFGHTEMRIPIKALFEKIYTLIIKESGI